MAAAGEIVLSGWFKAVDEGRLSRGTMNKICRVEMYNAVKSYMTIRVTTDSNCDSRMLGFQCLVFISGLVTIRSANYRNTSRRFHSSDQEAENKKVCHTCAICSR